MLRNFDDSFIAICVAFIIQRHDHQAGPEQDLRT